MYTFPLWAQLLALALPALAGTLVCRALLQKHPDVTVDTALRHLRHLWPLLALSALVVVGVFRIVRLPFGQQAALPAWLVEAAPVVLWTTISATFAYLFALTIALARRTAHPQWRQLAVAAVLGLTAILVAQHTITAPLWPTMSNIPRITDDGAILQTTDDTCAPAAAANVAHALGLTITERQLARAMHTTMLGTTTTQMIRGMRAHDILCTPFSVNPDRPDLAPTPAIAFVHLPGGHLDAHAVALLHATSDTTELVDPLSGRINRLPDEWTERWAGRGIACRLQEPQN